MLRSLGVKNLRGISSGGIDGLTDVNVLVGKNNSGKSTILDSIYLLNNAFSVNDCFGNYILDYILSKKSSNTNESSLYYKYEDHRVINLQVEFDLERVADTNDELQERRKLRQHSGSSTLGLAYSQGSWRAGDMQISNVINDGEKSTNVSALGGKHIRNDDSIIDFLESEEYDPYSRHAPSKMRDLGENILNTQYFHSGIFQIFESMENEIWSKMHRSRGDRSVYSAINEIYGENIDNITYVPDDDGENLRLLFDDYASASSSLGDGLRFTFILLSALESYNSRIALIEEPENHQHPSAYSGLADRYSSYSQQNQIQLFIATHSYDFIRGLAESTKKYGLDLNIFHLDLDDGNLETRTMDRPDVEMLEDIGIDPRRLKEYG